ncbi:MAG: ABC transporter ATP-binding protein [Actinomycetaceae bacterium]|nr:ABC transporter ATP-binding protein [Actinomycetaceae bacterium]
MNPYGVELINAGYSYRKTRAVVDVTTTIAPGSITGLLGRNGSGKSTLAMMIAGQLKARGQILANGESIWENPNVMPNIALVSDSPAVFVDQRLTDTIALWTDSRPTFAPEVALKLLDVWEINTKKHPEKLSRGQQSAFYAALGIASRSPLTIFDEVHLGMDAVIRREFYDALLQDYVAHPRTIVMSSHNVEEIEDLLENVLILDAGRLVVSGSADDVRAAHSTPGRVASLVDVLAATRNRTTAADALQNL